MLFVTLAQPARADSGRSFPTSCCCNEQPFCVQRRRLLLRMIRPHHKHKKGRNESDHAAASTITTRLPCAVRSAGKGLASALLQHAGAGARVFFVPRRIQKSWPLLADLPSTPPPTSQRFTTCERPCRSTFNQMRASGALNLALTANGACPSLSSPSHAGGALWRKACEFCCSTRWHMVLPDDLVQLLS